MVQYRFPVRMVITQRSIAWRVAHKPSQSGKTHESLGAAAAEIASQLADGTAMADIADSVSWSGGPNGVEMTAIFLGPVPVTADNLDVVIDAGWIAKDKVCEGAMESVAACQ